MGDLRNRRREPAWRRYWRFWGANAEADLDEEMAFHVQSRVDEYVAAGMDAASARRTALAQFGNVARYRRETGAVDGQNSAMRGAAVMLGNVREDTRFALRQVLRHRSLSYAAVSCLALGIGASTAIFTVVNAVLFRPLPFPEADRLVSISEGWSRIETDFRRISSPNIADFEAARGSAFASLGVARSWNGTIVVADGESEMVPGAQVSPSFFDVLGTRPRIGRAFQPADVYAGAPLVAVISDSYWRRRYGADPNVIGKPLKFASGRVAEVVGVMPPSFHFPFSALSMSGGDILMPLYIGPDQTAYRGNSYDAVAIGRLNAGVSVRAAEAALDNILQQFPARYPETYGKMVAMGGKLSVHVTPFATAVRGDVQRQLLLLLGAVGFLLLVACINVASLFVARIVARRREFDTRLALGATRHRVAQQLFVEALILLLAAAGIGLLLGWWGAKALVTTAPGTFYQSFDMTIDWRVVAVVLAVTVATAFAFAVTSLLSRRRSSLSTTERSGTAAPDRSRARRALIVAEIALALVLTIGSGLMIRSFARASAVDPGFDPAGVMTFQISLPLTRFTNANVIRATEQDLVARFRRVPGVLNASAGRPLPMTEGWQITFTPEGPPLANLPLATNAFVLPGFFETLRARLRVGRTFTSDDRMDAPRVVVVNETLARRYFAGNAVGRRLKWGGGPTNPWMTVIGVVADVKHDRLDGDPQPSVYMPVLQQDTGSVGTYRILSYVIRLATGIAPPMHALRAAIHDVDPQLSMTGAVEMDVIAGRTIAGRRFNASLLALFSALGLAVAATGVYGLLQYSVLQRTREIGIRVAMGAQRVNVVRLVIGDALRLTLVGATLGVLGGVALTRVMRSLLFATSPMDALSFLTAAALITGVSVAASYLPTRRALRIDPALAMRD